MRVVLILCFVVALLAGLVISAPARLVYDALAPAGVQAGRVQGSVWRGQALRVRVGDTVLRQVETALEPTSLLSGRPRVAMTVTDAQVQLTARVSAAGEGIRMVDAQGLVSVSVLPVLADLPVPADSIVRLDGVSFTLDRQGRCVSAEGAMMSPALADAGARYDLDLPILDMTVSCDGEVLALDLSGQSAVVDLEGVIRLDASTPSYQIVVTPHDPDIGGVLSLLGFRADGARWIADSDMREEG